MKYIFLFITLMISPLTLAGSGKAIIPSWDVSGHSAAIDLSNITENPIDVKIKLFNKDGSTADLASFGAESTFTIEPKATKRIILLKEGTYYGFGYIYWANQPSTGDDAVALIAHIFTRAHGKLPINDSRPF
ncbi:hypothetical protein D6089_09475 [Vibrio vulnificus]|nr:hypothetical protein [Vibrio vulnificus]EIY8041264.1 hypothetical protein [Vibrio vulnificus]